MDRGVVLVEECLDVRRGEVCKVRTVLLMMRF